MKQTVIYITECGCMISPVLTISCRSLKHKCWERERERERVCVCVCERERERERNRERESVCAELNACLITGRQIIQWEREREEEDRHQFEVSEKNWTCALIFSHISFGRRGGGKRERELKIETGVSKNVKKWSVCVVCVCSKRKTEREGKNARMSVCLCVCELCLCFCLPVSVCMSACILTFTTLTPIQLNSQCNTHFHPPPLPFLNCQSDGGARLAIFD